jgi:membrane protein insertase Oxa1/YidC/SpoIIIJ
VNAPSGLNLYWLVQNIIQMGQQFYTTKIMVPAEARRT